MIFLVVGCEIAFWVLLVTGLATRYLLRARWLSNVLLVSVPMVDVVLLAASVVDLRGGAPATTAHGLAAIYLGVSIAFGNQMIQWADQRFAHRFAGGPVPVKPPKIGRAHAAHERGQWLRHLLAYVLAVAVLVIFTLLVGDLHRTLKLWSVMAPWGIVLAIDFVISFSYTIAPRKRRSN
ncbi:2TM domain-containing protein [Actinopolymorpha singaporensis]|uniref:2TM domain-containing protein n=1 Tax=Actinopolymorpha singaporensis TaxID=117157 RepID=A0A1H1MF96_9ACTN|nr:2TM domain-containing protein [Actinopolymorpha singaporensis]SDR85473.1 hypothetical protein SAMN04489717_0802 [Actinopolymorpha singaporensis]